MARIVCNLSKSCFNTPLVFCPISKYRFSAFSQILVDHNLRNNKIYTFSTKPASEPKDKLTLVQRFKQMYRDYWYVLVPVHLVTSVGWFGSFYYLAKSGVDVVALLESLHVSDKFTNPLKDSSMGYVAIAYALYKISTPIRYTVTLGGTTISINYLKEWGYIKPVPSADKLKEIYKEGKENIMETFQEYKVKGIGKELEGMKHIRRRLRSNKYLKIPKKT